MICSKCKKVTDNRCFAAFRDRKGRLRRRGICRACRGQYALDNFEALQQWRRQNNKKTRSKRAMQSHLRREVGRLIVDKIKAETPCADCNQFFPPVAMDFDHIRGGKTRNVATLVAGAYKPELILAEIKLCEVVCACCHRIRTAERKQNHAPRAASKLTVVV